MVKAGTIAGYLISEEEKKKKAKKKKEKAKGEIDPKRWTGGWGMPSK